MTMTRPLRADAERNRRSILCAAADAFARLGTDVPLEEVARLAGVGVGTLYRRFPTKDALLDALFEEPMLAYVAHAESARDLAASDPWRAFREHVEFLARQQAADLGFSEVMRDPARGSSEFQHLHRRALAASLALVKRAKVAGVLRADFRHGDLLLLADANHGVIASRRTRGTVASDRLVALLLESFAAGRVATAPPQAER